MKILYVYQYCGLGGVEISIINKIEALKSVGIQAQAILFNVWCEGGKYILNNSNVKANITSNEIVDILNDNFDFITIIDFPQFINIIGKFDIKSKIIYETHCSEQHLIQKSYDVINHKKISAIIVPSSFNKRMILKSIKTDKNIFVVPNPVDMNLFNNIPISKLNKNYHQYSNKINIIWVGRLDKNKNALDFIKMGHILLENNNNLHFILVGEPFADLEYSQLIKNNVLKDYASNFTFLSSIPNEVMPELYSLSANTGGCLVLTSKNESLPMIFLEAASCKCPIVSTNVGGIEEFIINNKTGKTYELNNISEGIKAIGELIDRKNNTARNEIINNAYMLVKSRHSADQVATLYKNVLNYIINKQ